MYDHLHTLKVEYGEELDWLIPLPRDWHNILQNYQEVVMKAYFDGGLWEATMQTGCSDGVLNSIGESHKFILKVWESIVSVF